MEKLIRINIFVNSFPTASETFLFNLVTGLEQRGIDVTVIASAKSLHKALYNDRMNEWSGKIKYLKANPLKYFFHYLNAVRKNFILFLELLKQCGWRKGLYLTGVFESLTTNKPDIIHFAFSGIAVQYLPIISALNEKTRTMVSCRGTGEKVKPIVDPQRSQELALLFQSIQRVHCVSEDMLDTVTQYGLDRQKAFINRPAIQTEKFLFSNREEPDTSNPYIIVTTGRLNYQKGYLVALLALQKLTDKGKKIEYHILGDGPDREELQYFIHELGMQGKVHLHGRVSAEKVREFLDKAHIFLLPSVYEGISNAALESMAMGVPLITTNAGGMEEVIQNGVNGCVIQRFDQQSMANALLTVMENYENAVKMAEKAFLTIQSSYKLEKQVAIFIKEYHALIQADAENSSL